MTDTIHPSQAAGILEVNPRTLRRWSKKFSKSLSASARRSGKKRGYTGADIEMLRQAGDHLASGKTIKETAELLPIVDPNIESTGSSLVLAPEANIALGEALANTKHLMNTSDDHDQRLESLEAQILELDRALKWKSTPWWRKLRGAPPD